MVRWRSTSLTGRTLRWRAIAKREFDLTFGIGGIVVTLIVIVLRTRRRRPAS